MKTLKSIIKTVYIICFILTNASLTARQPVWNAEVPFNIVGKVYPDNSYYEANETVRINITITLDKNHHAYQEGKQYHIKTNGYVGYSNDDYEIISSGADSLFIMDDNSDLLSYSVVIKTKQLVNTVGVSFLIGRIGINHQVKDDLEKGLINSKIYMFDWGLNHDAIGRKRIFNSNASRSEFIKILK